MKNSLVKFLILTLSCAGLYGAGHAQQYQSPQVVSKALEQTVLSSARLELHWEKYSTYRKRKVVVDLPWTCKKIQTQCRVTLRNGRAHISAVCMEALSPQYKRGERVRYAGYRLQMANGQQWHFTDKDALQRLLRELSGGQEQGKHALQLPVKVIL